MKDNLKIILFSLFAITCLILITMALIVFDQEIKKTELGLAVLYFIGVLFFLSNVYAFFKKKVMRFRSLVFYHPIDKEMRVFILCVSIMAVVGFSYAFIESLLKIL